VRALPDDGNRYELISGQLVVTPSPRGIHQVAVSEFSWRIRSWLERTGAGRILASPADISLGEDEVLQPDLFIYRTATGKHLRDWSDITALVLVIEVLSSSSARYDRQVKRRRYQRARVPEYWIVDLDARLIERWRPDDERPEIIGERLTWEAVPGAGALELDLRALFAEIWGDEPSPS
jgi:Uma2 family endonuclease